MKITRRAFLSGALKSASAFLLFRMGLGARPAGAGPGSVAGEGPVDDRAGLPGSRVVSVRSPGAVSWDFETHPYIDHIDGRKVGDMLGAGLRELTGAVSVKEAWRRVVPGYRPGQRIAIKPNFNDLHGGIKGMITSPALINAVIDGLVSSLGVAPGDIIVYDLCRLIPDEMRARFSRPVTFLEPYGSSLVRKLEYRAFGFPLAKADPRAPVKMTREVLDKAGRPVRCYMPVVLTSVQHIINMPLLKAHRFVSNSGALKNHYGSVRFSDGSMSPRYLHPPIIEDSIVDINAHREIRTKTRLIVMDGLFGRIDRDGPPVRWKTFGGGTPAMLLLSRDPVATDSVARHLLAAEMDLHGRAILSDEYLRVAASRGLGTYEAPPEGKGFEKIDRRDITL